MATKQAFSEVLRQAILQAPMSRYEMAQRSGVTEGALSFFVNGHRGLTTTSIDKLAPVLGLELHVKKTGSKKGK
jgi:plasmid maintenance system antidote protein VapI